MSNVLFDIPGPRAARRHRIVGGITIVGLVAIVAAIVWKFNAEGQFAYEKWEPFVTPSLVQLLLEGLAKTLLAGVLAIFFAVILGLLLGAAKLSDHRIVRWPAWLFVEFFRAVPLLMLVIFIWSMQGFPLGTIQPLVLALLLYNGSVLAEIVRAGVKAVPPGQAEAAYAIGMRKNQVMRIILLPQAIKIMLPSFISQCIVAVKDTSLGFYILAPGLTFAGREIWRSFNNYLQTAIVLGIIYIIVNLLLGLIGEWLQRRIGGESRLDVVDGVVRPQSDAKSAAGPV